MIMMMMMVTMAVGSDGDLNAGLNIVALAILPLSAILIHLIADDEDAFDEVLYLMPWRW